MGQKQKVKCQSTLIEAVLELTKSTLTLLALRRFSTARTILQQLGKSSILLKSSPYTGTELLHERYSYHRS